MFQPSITQAKRVKFAVRAGAGDTMLAAKL
jgi:hypothetical protein